jgi:hypothetical protein
LSEYKGKLLPTHSNTSSACNTPEQSKRTICNPASINKKMEISGPILLSSTNSHCRLKGPARMPTKSLCLEFGLTPAPESFMASANLDQDEDNFAKQQPQQGQQQEVELETTAEGKRGQPGAFTQQQRPVEHEGESEHEPIHTTVPVSQRREGQQGKWSPGTPEQTAPANDRVFALEQQPIEVVQTPGETNNDSVFTIQQEGSPAVDDLSVVSLTSPQNKNQLDSSPKPPPGRAPVPGKWSLRPVQRQNKPAAITAAPPLPNLRAAPKDSRNRKAKPRKSNPLLLGLAHFTGVLTGGSKPKVEQNNADAQV